MMRAPSLFTSRQFTTCRSLSTTPTIARSASAALAMEELHPKPRPYSEVPTPGGAVPLLGHVPLMRRNPGTKRFELFGRLFKELGPIFKFKLPGGMRILLLSDPASIEKVYRNEGEYPIRSSMMSGNFKYLFDDLMLPTPFIFSEEKDWKEKRRAQHKQIHPANVHSYSPRINRVTDRLLRNLESKRDEDGFVDIHPHVINWSMEAAASFAFGADIDLSKEDNEEALQMQHAVQELVSMVTRYTEALPIYKIYPTPLYNKVKRTILTVRAVGRKYLERHRGGVEKKIREGGSTEGLSLLEQWMIAGQMSEEDCITGALDVFVAGIDTTSNYGTFTLYEVAKHPEVQEKLQQQVLSVLGEKGEADPESLQKMPYLRDVIKESHRVNPIIAANLRELHEDIELMGYLIPARTLILMDQTTRGFDKSLFKDPEKFIPERWSGDDDRPHPFSVLPFGYGQRNCFGRRFAELELKILLTKMCRYFNMTVDGPRDTRLPHNYTSIRCPGVPVRMKLSPRM